MCTLCVSVVFSLLISESKMHFMVDASKLEYFPLSSCWHNNKTKILTMPYGFCKNLCTLINALKCTLLILKLKWTTEDNRIVGVDTGSRNQTWVWPTVYSQSGTYSSNRTFFRAMTLFWSRKYDILFHMLISHNASYKQAWKWRVLTYACWILFNERCYACVWGNQPTKEEVTYSNNWSLIFFWSQVQFALVKL